jgi:hypothetical protein
MRDGGELSVYTVMSDVNKSRLMNEKFELPFQKLSSI